jgi:hypothetical protein
MSVVAASIRDGGGGEVWGELLLAPAACTKHEHGGAARNRDAGTRIFLTL